jgi:hypothetical protein
VDTLWGHFVRAIGKEWAIGIVVGVVVGIVIWVVSDLLPVGDSRIRAFLRLMRNKLSERSVAQLRKRIKELERYRDGLNRMMASDKALYLGALRAIFGTLFCMGFGAILVVLRHSVMLAAAEPKAPDMLFLLDMGSIAMFSIGLAVALNWSLTMVAEDNEAKVSAQIEKYTVDIENLKRILKERLQTLGS